MVVWYQQPATSHSYLSIAPPPQFAFEFKALQASFLGVEFWSKGSSTCMDSQPPSPKEGSSSASEATVEFMGKNGSGSGSDGHECVTGSQERRPHRMTAKMGYPEESFPVPSGALPTAPFFCRLIIGIPLGRLPEPPSSPARAALPGSARSAFPQGDQLHGP